MITYILIGVLYRNTLLITKRLYTNLKNIKNRKEEFQSSKERLTNGLKEITKILQGKEYFGGERPHHFDFYLFALLKTKWSSKHFRYYLEHSVDQ